MSVWLALGHQTAVCTSRCEELLFSLVLGLAYILAFIAPRDGPTRYSYLAYYLVFFMENTGALVVW
jgi:XK-related protein.